VVLLFGGVVVGWWVAGMNATNRTNSSGEVVVACGGAWWGGCGTVRCVHCGGWWKGVTMPFFGSLFDPKTSLWEVPGRHFGALEAPFWCPGPPRGSQWGPSGVKGAFFMDFGCPWGPPWGSLWDHFTDFFEFVGVKVAGCVADLLFKWFWDG
jgi:hypothetical protein